MIPQRPCRISGVMLGVAALLALAGPAGAEYAGVTDRPVVDPAIPAYAQTSNLSGNMVIAGSDTMQPLMLQLATRFRQLYPDTKIAIQAQGTEKGRVQFLSDQAAIRRGDAYYSGQQVSGSVAMLASSRPLSAEDLKDFRARYGYEPTEVPIALGAVAIYVQRDNPIQGLTLEQIDAIFGTDHRRGLPQTFTTWGQVGLTEAWAEQPIHLYGRDQKSGTRTVFKQVALLDGDFRTDIREEPGSASEILSIGRDPLAIGYAGIGFQTSAVRTVPLAEKAGMPFITASAETAANGTYPMGRYLYLYVKKQPGIELKPVVIEFLKFINSREGQQAAVKAGVFPLTMTQVAKNLQALTGSAVAAGPAVTADTH